MTLDCDGEVEKVAVVGRLGTKPLAARSVKTKAARYETRLACDRTGIAELDAVVRRVHGGTLQLLLERRSWLSTQRKKKRDEQKLKDTGAREYRAGVEGRERERAVRQTLGQRMSWRRWGISRKLICKEDRAVRDARVVKRCKRWCLRTFTLGCEAYLAGFEEAVGCTEAEYMDATSVVTAHDVLHEHGTEAHAQHLAHATELNGRKLAFVASLGCAAMARQLGGAAADPIEQTRAFISRFGPESTARARICWSELARMMQGPRAVQSTTKLARNAGQQWQGIMRASEAVNVDLLCPCKGDRGFHTRRSANFKVKVGSKWISISQRPTARAIKDLFQEQWVKTGLVTLGMSM